MAVEGDADVRMLFKGNEECEYFYVGETDGLKRRAQKEGASCEGRTWSCDHGVVCPRSGMGMLWCKRVVMEMTDSQE